MIQTAFNHSKQTRIVIVAKVFRKEGIKKVLDSIKKVDLDLCYKCFRIRIIVSNIVIEAFSSRNPTLDWGAQEFTCIEWFIRNIMERIIQLEEDEIIFSQWG